MSEASDSTGGGRLRQRKTAAGLVVVYCAMLGLAFASVPLYRLFCQVTGYGGTTQRADANPSAATARILTVRFDTNVAADMPWQFKPAQAKLDVKVGETALAFFTAHNPSANTITGTAAFNVTPDVAGPYFNKIQCFCFDQQVLKPGESVEMPVSFFIDPAFLKEAGADRIDEITLSYTFFKTEESAAARTVEQPTRNGS
jgi:cytochrome c oxidase assembly protein subunit 11